MSRSYNIRQQVTYGCGCKRYFSSPIPPVGESLLCFTHGLTYRVESAIWHLQCVRCKYARHSLGKLSVQVKAEKHANKVYHEVKVWCESEGEETTVTLYTPPERVMLTDVPPF